MAGLYLMTKPPPGARALIADLRARFHLSAAYPAEHLHTTFVKFGNGPATPALIDAAAAIDAPAFRMVFDLVKDGSLYGSEPMHGAVAFQEKLANAFTDAGIQPLPHQFDPHITLDYSFPRMGPHPVDGISWQVREFILIQSFGGRHRLLGRWPLRT